MDNIRAILSPVFRISYLLGIRVIEYPAGRPKLWCSFVYILLIWTIYHLIWWYTIRQYTTKTSATLQFCLGLNHLTALFSVVLGIYYDKKYRNCLKKLSIVDNTLKKIGIVTDYQKLYTKTSLIIFGWSAYLIYVTIMYVLWFNGTGVTVYSFCVTFVAQYPFYVNLFNDLVIIATLRYIELKFEQLNEFLRKLEEDNKQELKRDREHSVLFPHETEYPKFTNSENVTWIIIHLHLELCKISRALNCVFELYMTLRMGVNFAFISLSFREIFNVMLIPKYEKMKTLYITMYAHYLAINIYRLYIINYTCEKVSVKANTTGDVINRVSYSTFNIVVRENVSQFILQTSLTPLKFYGLKLFQFGLKFFHGFSSSITTIIVILLQSYTQNNKN